MLHTSPPISKLPTQLPTCLLTLISDGIFGYVIATSHFDKDELLPGAVSGWSECAETLLVEYIRAKAGGAGYTAIPCEDYALGHNQIDYNGKTAIGLHAKTVATVSAWRRSTVEDCTMCISTTAP